MGGIIYLKNQNEIREIINYVIKKGSTVIPETLSKQIFEYCGANIPKQGLAKTEEEAISLAKSIGFPVVLKVHSFEIVHKSDARGVLVGLSSPEAVKEGFRSITENVYKHLSEDKEIHIAVQKMVEPGTEIILGMKRDEVFGPTILFGLGGVWVEVLQDVSLRVAPLNERDIDEMFSEIRGSALLENFRGSPARDLSALKPLMFQIEQLAVVFPEISEIDLNPVFLYEEGNGAIIVDARIVLSSENWVPGVLE